MNALLGAGLNRGSRRLDPPDHGAVSFDGCIDIVLISGAGPQLAGDEFLFTWLKLAPLQHDAANFAPSSDHFLDIAANGDQDAARRRRMRAT
ncbi:hypothetical protein SAMN05216330_12139 [Bradyrhizobium sp. Ghvi]|nr:hypothetical protein SAMN05216330_12139 [Bradyrhizobium sp. Ghvi]